MTCLKDVIKLQEIMINKLKNNIRYILWFLSFREILSRSTINSVKIIENNDPLVKIIPTERLTVYSENENISPIVRKSVLDKLHKASLDIPSGYSLMIIEAFRSPEIQQEKWNKRFKEVSIQNPNLSKEELFRITRLGVASPTGEGPHQTGGAVDVTLTLNGKKLDMGTEWLEFNAKTPTNSKEITNDQMSNRKVLLNVMKKYGFVNYPGEWWHYSYGDRMWAAYLRKRVCHYGPIQQIQK